MNEMVERAIQTEERAKTFLFDRRGKRKGNEHYLKDFVFTFVLPKATIEEVRFAPGEAFDWRGTTLTYDAGACQLRKRGKGIQTVTECFVAPQR